MKKWLIVHSLESYGQNSRLVGFHVKTNLDGSVVKDENGNPVPKWKTIKELKAGDKIVYYCKSDYVIKGIYKVGQLRYGEEVQWPESPYQYEISPIIELDIPYDFKLLVPSLELFQKLSDRRQWGSVLQGLYNSIKLLTEHDYQIIEEALTQAKEEVPVEIEEYQEGLPNHRQHLLIQHQIAEWGLKNNRRVHVAINDKSKIKEYLPKILEDIPKFHEESILNIARRIDVLFFDEERDILTHAFEVEHTSAMYSGLLRLNDIAERYPYEKAKYYIISDEDNRRKFEQELDRPSFYMLRKRNCTFRNYDEVNEEWKHLQSRRTPIF